jgi:putative SOS response-associated peptidase YedK
MCTRFSRTTQIQAAARQERFRDPRNRIPGLTPQYNIAPTDEALVGLDSEDGLIYEKMVFGLVPRWAKDIKMGLHCLNARSETIHEKPSFRDSFLKRRCVVFSDGFYDWRTEGKTKQPFRFVLKSQTVFSLAGLWDEWVSPQGRKLQSFAIVTTQANGLVSTVNDRMPVILSPENEAVWLAGGQQNPAVLLPLLQPFPTEKMESFPVSPKMNRSSYKEADCVSPISLTNNLL